MTLPVLRQATGPAGAPWVLVRLPYRPNGATGWVPAGSGRFTETTWLIVVHRSARQVEVLENGERRARFVVVVGRPSTPTPLGNFFAMEKIHVGYQFEGPWAIAMNAYSDVFQHFEGGPGQVAFHGNMGFPDPLGSAASDGCIRFSAAAITWIAEHVGLGTPINVVP
jgi:lipoprotein-anchoring transpeptidase ErfK/SrfK